MIDKNGMIKEMDIEKYSNKEGEFSLEFNQTPFGDLAVIHKHGVSKNKTMCAIAYLRDSTHDDKLRDENIDRAKKWFYDVINIK